MSECRDRWKNLRAGLTRYLKLKDKTRVKKYYLYDVMGFVLPFTKTKDDHGQLIKAKRELSDEHSSQSNNECEESVDNFFFDAPIDQKDFDIAYVEPDSDEHNTRKRKYEDSSNSVVSESGSQLDLCFFKSLLGDLSQFSPRQKRKFKMKVLQVLDEIASENENDQKETEDSL